MTGISANCNSVSSPKTAVSCGLTLSAAIRRIMKSGDNPKAAIPETVIIGDRGLEPKAANFATKTASQLFTILYIIKQNLRQDDTRQDLSHLHADDHSGTSDCHHLSLY